MASYLKHAESSVSKFGGKIEDYIKIHKIMDSSKEHFGGFQHRLFSHNTWFCSVIVELLGDYIVNSDNNKVMVRDICYQHLVEDHGKAPTISDWLANIDIKMNINSKWINSPEKIK